MILIQDCRRQCYSGQLSKQGLRIPRLPSPEGKVLDPISHFTLSSDLDEFRDPLAQLRNQTCTGHGAVISSPVLGPELADVEYSYSLNSTQRWARYLSRPRRVPRPLRQRVNTPASDVQNNSVTHLNSEREGGNGGIDKH